MVNKANKDIQKIKLADGTIKNIFHQKLNSTRGDYKQWWSEMNKTPNPNSKRQLLIKKQLDEKI